MPITELKNLAPTERQKVKMNNVTKGVLTRLKELDPDKLKDLLNYTVKVDDPEVVEQLIKDEFLFVGRKMNGDYYISAMSLINSILNAGGYGRVWTWVDEGDETGELQIATTRRD